MNIIRNAIAGTMESSDLIVTVTPGSGLTIDIQSPVKRQFGDSIRRSAEEIAQDLGVTDAVISIDDHGALDCTIRARVETALLRASKEE
ncbi:MAG: citrate lyase acyl carrier protein [Lachnospiraceae bacterium]|nr:citrate lyase acyl carrier protein [Lachnospiraceae bacterium]